MLMKMRSKMQNQKGFTLVELMVVVVILGILVAIAVPVYNSVTNNANKRAVEANLRTIDGAIMQYMATTDDAAPVPTAGDDGNLVPKFLQAWPEGPDGVTYTVEDGRAVASAGNDTGAWWTVGDKVSLPITWEEEEGEEEEGE